MKDWLYKGKEITEAPEGQIGFVYCITNLSTKQAYIGKKFLSTRRRKKIFGRKNRKILIHESDWRTYTGSNNELNADIEYYGDKNFTREILEFYPSKKEISYAETEQQFLRDVLRSKTKTGKFAYYNSNIGGKWFRVSIKQNDKKSSKP